MTVTATTIEMTREDIARLLGTGSRRRLAMEPEAMVAAYREGRLPDPGRVADLLTLASLLSKDDPLFVAA